MTKHNVVPSQCGTPLAAVFIATSAPQRCRSGGTPALPHSYQGLYGSPLPPSSSEKEVQPPQKRESFSRCPNWWLYLLENMLNEEQKIKEAKEKQYRLREEAWRVVSTSELGSRGLQEAIVSVNSDDERVQLASVLKGHVNEAWRSRYANFFLEKCVQTLTVNKLEFIVVELLEELPGCADGSLQVDAASTHTSGVRVLQSLIKFHSTSLKKFEEITTRIVQRTMDLVNNGFGNILLKTLLEHGTDDVRQEVMNRLTDVHEIAKHHFGSHVIRAALDLCPHFVHPKIVCNMRKTLSCHKNELKSTFSGSYVIKALRDLERRERVLTTQD